MSNSSNESSSFFGSMDTDNEVQSADTSKNPFPNTQDVSDDSDVPWEEETPKAASKPVKQQSPSEAINNMKLPSETIQMGNNTTKPFSNKPPRTNASRSRTANAEREEAKYWLNVGIKYKTGEGNFFASPVGMGIPVTTNIKKSNTNTSNSKINTSNKVANRFLEQLEAIMSTMKEGEVKYVPVTLAIRKVTTKTASSDLDDDIEMDGIELLDDIK